MQLSIKYVKIFEKVFSGDYYMNQELKQYIKNNIFPMYDRYYSHGMLHINNVINNCLMLAAYYNLDSNKAYTIAAYHDVGLCINRNNH